MDRSALFLATLKAANPGAFGIITPAVSYRAAHPFVHQGGINLTRTITELSSPFHLRFMKSCLN